MIERKRIGSLEFKPASYLLPKNKWPKHPAWSIDMWIPNFYYGRDNEYPEDPNDNSYRLYLKYPNHRIHKSCFKHPETCFTLASFEYNEHEEFYGLQFCGDRPIEYLNTPDKRNIFWELLEYGNEQLNIKKEDEES